VQFSNNSIRYSGSNKNCCNVTKLATFIPDSFAAQSSIVLGLPTYKPKEIFVLFIDADVKLYLVQFLFNRHIEL